jgi:hypothetical protein
MNHSSRQVGRYIWKLAGGLVVVVGSFYTTLKVMDYWDARKIAEKVTSSNPITIEEATYGANCGKSVKAGNVTPFAAKACDSRITCNISISVLELGDPAQGCWKDYSLSFRCGNQKTIRKLHVNGEANGSSLVVDCEQHSAFW